MDILGLFALGFEAYTTRVKLEYLILESMTPEQRAPRLERMAQHDQFWNDHFFSHFDKLDDLIQAKAAANG